MLDRSSYPFHRQGQLVKLNRFSLLTHLQSAYIEWRFGAIDTTAAAGVRGEQAAAQLLRRKGLLVIAQSESDRFGEIDLIAFDRRKQTLVFVEVKTLATTKPGHPADRIDRIKQQKITRTALRYLKRKRLLGTATRFDVVAVWWPSDHSAPTRIEHYESAFEATDSYQLY
jgi:putative endonuclease